MHKVWDNSHWQMLVSLRRGVPLENISCLEFVDRGYTVAYESVLRYFRVQQ